MPPKITQEIAQQRLSDIDSRLKIVEFKGWTATNTIITDGEYTYPASVCQLVHSKNPNSYHPVRQHLTRKRSKVTKEEAQKRLTNLEPSLVIVDYKGFDTKNSTVTDGEDTYQANIKVILQTKNPKAFHPSIHRAVVTKEEAEIRLQELEPYLRIVDYKGYTARDSVITDGEYTYQADISQIVRKQMAHYYHPNTPRAHIKPVPEDEAQEYLSQVDDKLKIVDYKGYANSKTTITDGELTYPANISRIYRKKNPKLYHPVHLKECKMNSTVHEVGIEEAQRRLTELDASLVIVEYNGMTKKSIITDGEYTYPAQLKQMINTKSPHSYHPVKSQRGRG